jgi:CBS-domain-containing membrane protein
MLSTFRLEPDTALAQISPVSPERVDLAAPALSVMTDLTQVRAVTVRPETLLAQAEQAMIHAGVRMLFVVTTLPHIEGLVTSTDLHGERQLRAVHLRGVRYDELCVADVMTPLSMLDAVDHARMRACTVADVVAALARHGGHHLLVAEQGSDDGTPRRVRGVLSRSQIERQTGTAIDLVPVARSFSEIEQALR